MKRLIIDRITGGVAICETLQGDRVEINAQSLPSDAKEGDCLLIRWNGEILIDEQYTAQRRQRMIELTRQCFEEEE